MRFKIGQEVTPNKKEFNVVLGNMGPEDMPQYGKVYTVAGYPLHGRTGVAPEHFGMMQLEEMKPKMLYHEDCFEALVSDEKLEADIKELDYA